MFLKDRENIKAYKNIKRRRKNNQYFGAPTGEGNFLEKKKG